MLFLRMLSAEIPRRIVVADDQVGNTIDQLRAEVQINLTLVDVPAHLVADGIVTRIKAELL